MADRVQISLDQTAQALWEEMEEEINNIYDKGGRSEFFRSVLMQYADEATRLEVKKKLIKDKLQDLDNQREDLEMQLEIVEKKLDEADVGDSDKIMDNDDTEFWDETVEILTSGSKPFEKRLNKFFDGRLKAYRKRFDSIPRTKFKDQLFDELKQRGFDDEASMI